MKINIKSNDLVDLIVCLSVLEQITKTNSVKKKCRRLKDQLESMYKR